MNRGINAILIHGKDNVITTTEALPSGGVARYQNGEDVLEVIVREEIPEFHKIALSDLQESEPVYKYGQLIGEARRPIRKGDHVHDHNIQSPKRKS